METPSRNDPPEPHERPQIHTKIMSLIAAITLAASTVQAAPKPTVGHKITQVPARKIIRKTIPQTAPRSIPKAAPGPPVKMATMVGPGGDFYARMRTKEDTRSIREFTLEGAFLQAVKRTLKVPPSIDVSKDKIFLSAVLYTGSTKYTYDFQSNGDKKTPMCSGTLWLKAIPDDKNGTEYLVYDKSGSWGTQILGEKTRKGRTVELSAAEAQAKFDEILNRFYVEIYGPE